ncbi:MAG: NrsF family protein, partial [Bradyrhizobium sp.]|nr:NrsF family protein [Bradyrhizobium sp.]
MKTDDLVALLSTNPEPVDRHSVARTLFVALAAGIVVALGIALLGLGVRPDLATTRALIFLAVKLAFAFGIVALALIYLTRLARPGGERKASPLLVAVPFLVV